MSSNLPEDHCSAARFPGNTLDMPMSLRNPKISRESNDADLIELQLQEDRHQTWGFVIYRTTYDSATEWSEFLRRLRAQMEESFVYINGMDILAKFQLTVFDDASVFNNASSHAIRQHFQRWSIQAYRTEQMPPPAERTGNAYADTPRIGRSPRYEYAIQVDAEALKSVVHDAPAPPMYDSEKRGWVRLIDKSWYLGRSEGKNLRDLEAIEGVEEYDVGWTKVAYCNVMTIPYNRCRWPNGWDRNYRRPPDIADF